MEPTTAEAVSIPIATLEEGEKISPEVLSYIPKSSAAYYKFVPLRVREGVLEIGILDPNNVEARDALQFISTRLGLPFKLFAIGKTDFDKVMQAYEGLTTQVTKALSELDIAIQAEEKAMVGRKPLKPTEVKIIEEAPVTKIVAVIIQHATAGLASDIHIEPLVDKTRVRFRVDGVLHTSLFLPPSVHEAVVARIKILTNMKLDERRKPQDGRFSARLEGRKVDFRVAVLPTYYGEKVAVRILDPERKLLTLDKVGLTPQNLEQVREALRRPYGLILVTGPTGSGKTTTLYAMLNEIDRQNNNVISLEDPIEYSLPGVNQSQVRPEIGYSFAIGLRHVLRQDPNIIMVGEIRDSVTAKLAVQSALTGHLVLSTLHTNNTAGVIPRLIDMGVEPYLIPATLTMAMAQRLVPLLCEDSKEAVPFDGSLKALAEKYLSEIPPSVRETIQLPGVLYRPKASPTCPSGLRGRIGVFEVLTMDRELERLLLRKPSEDEIFKEARGKGFLTMREDALLKALAGTIALEEVSKL